MGYQTLVIAVMLLAACAVATTTKKWFCQSYDCPSYNSTEMGAYELRNYTETTWAITSIRSRRPDPSWRQRRNMFRKLFKYIKENKIKMTVPVLVKTENLSPPYNISMMFYLTSSDSPTPRDKDVALVTRPEGIVYVRSFPRKWRPFNYEYRKELEMMKRVVEDSSLYVGNIYYKARYNSPRDLFKKKQFEVWMDSAPSQ